MLNPYLFCPPPPPPRSCSNLCEVATMPPLPSVAVEDAAAAAATVLPRKESVRFTGFRLAFGLKGA